MGGTATRARLGRGVEVGGGEWSGAASGAAGGGGPKAGFEGVAGAARVQTVSFRRFLSPSCVSVLVCTDRTKVEPIDATRQRVNLACFQLSHAMPRLLPSYPPSVAIDQFHVHILSSLESPPPCLKTSRRCHSDCPPSLADATNARHLELSGQTSPVHVASTIIRIFVFRWTAFAVYRSS